MIGQRKIARGSARDRKKTLSVYGILYTVYNIIKLRRWKGNSLRGKESGEGMNHLRTFSCERAHSGEKIETDGVWSDEVTRRCGWDKATDTFEHVLLILLGVLIRIRGTCSDI